MKAFGVAVVLLPLASCAASIPPDRLQWAVECPSAVEKGAAFEFTVRARDTKGAEVTGVDYRYTIRWAPGSGNPLCQAGTTGAVMKAHARTVAGPAEISITTEDAGGAEIAIPLHPAPILQVNQ